MDEPQWIEDDPELYVGKRLLVGITYESAEGGFLRQEQFHGLIVEAGRDTGIVLERNDTGERISLPPQLVRAKPGDYRLRTTGEVVTDPDFLMQWSIREPADKPGTRRRFSR